MHAILFTVLVLGGTGSGYGGPATEGTAVESGYYGECDACAGGRHGQHAQRDHGGGCLGTPPQTCYDPSFGCYTSSRHMHRYPAFHGTFYRQAYNYRNYFDYPWHAGLHEPTSHFSFHVPGEAPVESVPTPAPEAATMRSPAPVYPAGSIPRPALRQATHQGQATGEPTPARTQSLLPHATSPNANSSLRRLPR